MSNRPWRFPRPSAIVLSGLMVVLPAAATERPDLLDLGLEDLVRLEVTSVAKRSQRLSDAAAAIFVITGDDIRRAGVTSIPEALRLAPGVEVAQIDANKWAISARGFNTRFANKLLVLVDGRSVYHPLFSGVFWDQQDTLLEDVERIEVIRGPGATLWGANAVNGVINVITRKAQETQGTLLTLGAGSEDKAELGFRHGGSTADGTAWRVFAKGLARDAGVDAGGGRGSDDSRSLRAGFRADGRLDATQEFTLQGEAFGLVPGERLTAPSLLPPFALTAAGDNPARGFKLGAALRHRDDDGESSLRGWIDRSEFNGRMLGDVREVWDLEYDRHHRLAGHTLSWGLGYRLTHDRTQPGIASMRPAVRTDRLFSAFVQDELALGDDFRLTLGSKFERNDYSGWEMQPSLRGLWRASHRQTWWAAVSKALRTPSRGEVETQTDLTATPGPFPGIPVLVQVQGNPDMQPERLVAWELGWRFVPAMHWAVDVAAFYNDYDRLNSQETGAPVPPGPAAPYILVPIVTRNLVGGSSRGFEVVVEGRPSERWRLQATYSHLRFRLGTEAGSNDAVTVAAVTGASPRNQLSLRSEWSVDSRTDVDFWIKRVDRLPAFGVPAYTSVNLRLAWRPSPGVEWSLVGQNLSDPAHPEILPELVTLQPTERQRALFAKLRLRF